MSSRLSYALAVLLLLIAAALRFTDLTSLPPGLADDEIDQLRITETVRQGRIEVFYNLGGEGREGLYNTVLAVSTLFTGGGLLGDRVLSVWLGLLTLALTYALVKRLYNPLAALAGLGLLTVMFWSTLLSRLVITETALPALVAGVLLALSYILPLRKTRPRTTHSTPYTALGVLLGLSFYLHPAAFLVTLASMLYIIYMLRAYRQLSRRRLGYIGYALVIMLVIVTPYVISSIRLPELAGGGRVFAVSGWSSLLTVLLNGLNGFFFIGTDNPLYNLPQRPLVDLVSGLVIIVGLIAALRYARTPRYTLPLLATLTLLPYALLQTEPPSFPAFSVLLPLLAVYFGLGVSTIRNGLPTRTRVAVYVGLLLLFSFNLTWMRDDLYREWRGLEGVQTAYHNRLRQLAVYLDNTDDDTPTIICVRDLAPPADSYAPLTDAQMLTLMLTDQRTPRRYVNCQNGMVFTNGGAFQQVILPRPNMRDDMHPHIQDWLANGTMLDRPDLPPDAVILLNVEEQLAERVGRFTTTAPVLYAPEAPGENEVTLPPVQFGEHVTFLGHEPQSVDIPHPPGDTIEVITYWRIDGPVPPNLRLFTHILFDPGEIAVQTDTISVVPRQLEPRDVFVQVTFVPVPFSMPDGTYPISIGAYQDAANDEADIRLNVFDGRVTRGTRLFLDQVVVSSGNTNG